MKVHPKAVITFFIFFDLMRIAAAQTDSKPFIQPEISNSDIAKKLANPISNVGVLGLTNLDQIKHYYSSQ
jgi:hypothetical protein